MNNHNTHYSFDLKLSKRILDNFPFQNNKVNINDKILNSNNKIINLVYNNKKLGTENIFYKERKYRIINLKKPKNLISKNSIRNYFLKNVELSNKKPTILTQNSINDSINNLTQNTLNNKNHKHKTNRFYKTINPSQIGYHRKSSLSLSSLDMETLKLNQKNNEYYDYSFI